MSGSTGRTTVGQLLTPAGQLTTLGDLPLNEALSPDGRYLIVSNNGPVSYTHLTLPTTPYV